MWISHFTFKSANTLALCQSKATLPYSVSLSLHPKSMTFAVFYVKEMWWMTWTSRCIWLDNVSSCCDLWQSGDQKLIYEPFSQLKDKSNKRRAGECWGHSIKIESSHSWKNTFGREMSFIIYRWTIRPYEFYQSIGGSKVLNALRVRCWEKLWKNITFEKKFYNIIQIWYIVLLCV